MLLFVVRMLITVHLTFIKGLSGVLLNVFLPPFPIRLLGHLWKGNHPKVSLLFEFLTDSTEHFLCGSVYTLICQYCRFYFCLTILKITTHPSVLQSVQSWQCEKWFWLDTQTQKRQTQITTQTPSNSKREIIFKKQKISNWKKLQKRKTLTLSHYSVI